MDDAHIFQCRQCLRQYETQEAMCDHLDDVHGIAPAYWQTFTDVVPLPPPAPEG